jgi:putative OPT family oligopeptide transporter
MSSPMTSAPPPTSAPKVKPYIAPEREIQEMTVSALVAGSILGIIFAASSVYLGLKVGLTVSASIPIAVLSITIFRFFGKSSEPKILVNNIVQTTGSAGESIAAGVAFTLPSLLLMGFEMDLGRVLLVALLGGVLGVLMMIPLRQGLIVKEHGKLTYPEGTACAQVLIVGEQGGTNAKTVFQGFGIGFLHMLLMKLFGLWKAEPEIIVNRDYFPATADATAAPLHYKNATLGGELTAPLLGVGYIIGYRTSAVMMAGGVLSFLVLVPLITFFGSAIPVPFGPRVAQKIADMSPFAIRNNYLLYIGAGAVATGGFISLARSLPTIWQAFRRGLGNISVGTQRPVRTEQDMSMKVVLFGSLALAIAIAIAPMLHINFVSAILIVLFGFFFVTVSSRITGEIGSSSNPISGMTVATLLITCLLFVAVGWTGVGYKEMALTTAALVCVAASNGGTISQDLKTGFLVGATPHRQQKAIMVGVVTSALVIGLTLIFLNESAQTIAPKHKQYAAVYTAPADALRNAAETEYEGRKYRVHYVADDQAPVPRGKYLVDEAGKIAYLVDPGVCGTETYRVKPPGDMAGAYAKLEAPPANADDAKKFAVDGVDYRVANDSGSGRTFLVDDASKTVAWEASRVEKYNAPKAQLFALIIDGIIGGQLPWTLVLVGVFIALMLELVGVSALPFAVGVYLPIHTVAPIFVGGIVRWFVDRKTKLDPMASEFSPGTLFASGLIAGGAIAGICHSFFAGGLPEFADRLDNTGFEWFGEWARLDGHGRPDLFALVPFGIMVALLVMVGMRARSDRPAAAR